MNGGGGAKTEDFQFESPGGGAYRVRLLGEDAANTASMILAGTDDVSSVNCLPGTYTAIIEPIGSGETLRQTIQLEAGSHEPIKLTDAMFQEDDAASGNETSQAPEGVTGQRFQYKVIYQSPEASVRPSRAPTQPDKKQSGKANRRGFSLGLSVRHARDPSRRWCPGALGASISDEPGGGVAITFRRPPDWRQRAIWRLTVAVADDPRWRMRIPLFTGGVQLVLTPATSPGGADIAVGLAPRNAGRAALVSNLESLFLGSAREVIRSSLPAFRSGGDDDLLAHLMDVDEDPWTISAAAIMLAQTDELMPMADTLARFAKKWKWIPDIAVLLAWISARDDNAAADGRDASCLQHLETIPGRPYFAASQALGMDLLTGLSMGGSSAELRTEAGKTREKWARISRRQVKTGPYLAAEDARLMRSHSLSTKNYTTIASGTVASSQIGIQPDSKPSRGKSDIPALDRDQTRSNDPWKGRFGGLPERDGYRLDATFTRGPGSWVEIDITIDGPAKNGEEAEFFLHDTYRPDRVKAEFKDGRACYTALAWGGFTVGGWIPRGRVELELDLSEMREAPQIIRDY